MGSVLFFCHKPKAMQIEICLFSPFNIPVLEKSTRIELCSNYNQGGLSPSFNSFLKCKSHYTNSIYIMVRPRGGDFCYSDEEFEFMKNEISWFKENGADGIVLGILHTDGSIDKERTKELVKLASPMPVTFHRAFDMSKNLSKSLETIIETGCTTILSSGGNTNVVQGFETLVELHNQADGRIEIMPGGGVSINNVLQFITAGFNAIHLSSKKVQISQMEYRANLSMTTSPSISSFNYIGVDFEKLKLFTSYVRENQFI